MFAIAGSARKVLAEDFLGSVALDPLGTGVPADDVSPRIEQEDRVLPHVRDEVLKLLVGHPQGLFRPLPALDFRLQCSVV